MKLNHNCLIFSDPVGTRTLDPLIKSQLLYQLSYGVINFNCKYRDKTNITF
jgi:hypothetical protein